MDKSLQFTIVFRGNDETVKKIADINKQLQGLRAEQKALSNEFKKGVDNLGVDKYNELQKIYARNESAITQLSSSKRELLLIQRKEAEAANSNADSYRRLAAETAVFERVIKSLEGSLGNSPEIEKLKEKLKANYEALKNFDREVGSSRNLVGDYENSIIRAFGQLGLVDALKGKLSELNTKQTELKDELEKLVKEYELLKGTGGQAFEDVKKKINDITGAIVKVDGAIGETQKGISSLTKTASEGFDGLEEHLTSIAAIFLGGFGAEYALEKVTEFLSESITEAINAEDQIDRLRLALENFGRVDALQGLIEQSKELAERLKFLGAGDIQQVQEQLISFGKLSINQIEALTPVIIDYSVKSKKTIPEAATDIIKALNGESKALKILGIEMSGGGDVAQNYAQIMNEVAGRVNGASESFSKGAKGALAEQKQRLKDLQEEIGGKLLPVYIDFLNSLREVTPLIKETLEPLYQFTGSVKGLIKQLIGADVKLEPFVLFMRAFRVQIETLIKPLSLVLQGLSNLINLGGQAITFVKDLGNGVSGALGKLSDNLSGGLSFKGLGSGVGEAFSTSFNDKVSAGIAGGASGPGLLTRIAQSIEKAGGVVPLGKKLGLDFIKSFLSGDFIGTNKDDKALSVQTFNLNTIQGIEARLEQLEQLRRAAVIGSEAFNRYTKEINALKLKLDTFNFKKVEVIFSDIAKQFASASLSLANDLIKSRLDALTDSLQRELEAEELSYQERLNSEKDFYQKLIADTKANIDKVKQATNLTAAQKSELITQGNGIITAANKELEQINLAIQIGADTEKQQQQLKANSAAANIAEAHGRNINLITKKWRDKDLQDLKDKLQTELNLIEANNALKIAGIDTNGNEQQAKLNEQYSTGLISYRKFIEETAALQNNFNRQRINQNIQATQAEIAALEKTFNVDKSGADPTKADKVDGEILLKRAQLYAQLADLERQLTDVTLSESEKRKAQLSTEIATAQQYVNQSAQAVSSLMQSLSGAESERINEQIQQQQKKVEDLQNQESKATGLLKTQLQARLKNERDYIEKLTAEQKQQQREAAQADKFIKGIQATINTALAVTAFLAKGDYAGAIAAGILGGIEVAAIFAAPLAKGGALDNDINVISGGNIPVDGGMISGRSHATGGVKFIDKVTGKLWEAEGNELFIRNGNERYIINRRSSANPYLRSLASAINVAGGGRPFFAASGAKLAAGGSLGPIISPPNIGNNSNVINKLSDTVDKIAQMTQNLSDGIINTNARIDSLKVIFVDKEYKQFTQTKDYIKKVGTL